MTHVEALKGAVEKLVEPRWPKPEGKFPVTSAGQVAELAYTVENLGALGVSGSGGKHQEPRSVGLGARDPHGGGAPRGDARHAGQKVRHPDGAFAKPADMSTVLAAVKPFLA